MREELTQKIIMLLQSEGVENEKLHSIRTGIIVILNDYEVENRETEITVRSEDINTTYLQKFLIAKTVSGRTERTLEFYKKTLVSILETINKPADDITADDIRFYLAMRQRRDGITKVTADNELRVLRSFFAYLLAEEIISKNPCLKIEKIKAEKQKKEAFEEIEVEKIRNACKSTKQKAIIELLLSTGCRVTELVKMMVKDLQGDKVIVHGKGQKDRIVYLNAKAQIAVQLYLAERNDINPYLFPKGKGIKVCHAKGKPELRFQNKEYIEEEGHTDKASIEQCVRKIGRRAGVEKCHPHRFRRTCATFALRRGMPVEQVSKMLGHDSIATTQIYLDLSEEELQQAHKKYVI